MRAGARLLELTHARGNMRASWTHGVYPPPAASANFTDDQSGGIYWVAPTTMTRPGM
jgi:hypothetical protein